MLKPLLVILGSVSLILGIIGIITPGIPTTPFLLLTAGLYVRSSDRLYHSLIRNRYLGRYLLSYRKNRGMTRSSKLLSITMMWSMIFLSAFVFIRKPGITLILSIAGLIGTGVMGFIIPTIQRKIKSNEELKIENRKV